MSSVEIEDVLSSIRRLVSEDLRPAARPAPTPASPPASHAATQMAASKLILTPALRVVADDTPVAVAEPVAARDAEPWDDGEVAAFVNVEDDTLFEDDAEVRLKADVISLTPQHDPARHQEDAGRLAEPAPDVMPEIAPAPVSEHVPPTVDAPVEVPVADPAEWTSQPDADLRDWDDDRSEDAVLVDEAVAEPLDAVWADAAEAEVLRQLADEGVTSQASSQAGPQAAPLSEDDMIYEENLLRDLVRDIIREELQGELGERITRNVRKLVRAEIARAMALRDFD